MTTLFVYGSLKRGFSNQQWLEGQTFVGTAATAALYRMFDYGGFPALVLAAPLGVPGVCIRGELWEVEPVTLDRLDVLEGVPHGLYARAEIRLAGDRDRDRDPDRDHRPHYAIGYLYQKTVSAFPDVGDTWTPALDLAGLRSPERVNP